MTKSARSSLAILPNEYHRFHKFADPAFCSSSNNWQCLRYSSNLSRSHTVGMATTAVHHLSHARFYPLRRMTATDSPTARHATARRSQAEFFEWLGCWAILDYGAMVWRHTCHAPRGFLGCWPTGCRAYGEEEDGEEVGFVMTRG